MVYRPAHAGRFFLPKSDRLGRILKTREAKYNASSFSVMIQQVTLQIATRKQGLIEVTDSIGQEVRSSGITRGLVNVFCQHTSCSLMIMENADPSAGRDLEVWLNRLVPERDPLFEHTLEGPDDMPSHIKMALTRTSETVPIDDGRMLLGTWQGIFLWEHRRVPHTRRLLVTVTGE
jgi:secondary thiamine-phosphate synthase enzyme